MAYLLLFCKRVKRLLEILKELAPIVNLLMKAYHSQTLRHTHRMKFLYTVQSITHSKQVIAIRRQATQSSSKFNKIRTMLANVT
ncbi:hypothetical protein H5410_008365 [Solanum commersonii]|uniref:Uncharacterized protein n=1 Tax=Solanum commersonii TaxID=4109 RepID=A0A9J6AFJ5_SOLCO|nr:hypothetical protein H5410_008365 [Solanum commersonii]